MLIEKNYYPAAKRLRVITENSIASPSQLRVTDQHLLTNWVIRLTTNKRVRVDQKILVSACNGLDWVAG